MTRTDRAVLVVLTGAAIAVPAALGLGLRWPTWLWPLLILLLLLVPLLEYQQIQRRLEREARLLIPPPPPPPRPPLPEPPPVVSPPPPFQREVVVNIGLPSATEDYEFLFSATVFWRPTSEVPARPHANPVALAITSIIERAEIVTAQEPPRRCSIAQHRLSGVLDAVLTDSSRAVEAWAGEIQLALGEEDAARLSELANVRKEMEVWEHGRHHERNKREYYGQDVFKDPGSALIWWLAHTEDGVDVSAAVELIGTLAQLSAAANNTTVPELLPALLSLGMPEPPATEPPVEPLPPQPQASEQPLPEPSIDDEPPAEPTVVESDTVVAARRFMTSLDLDDDRRPLFADWLAKAAAGIGRSDAATELRDTFDPPAPQPAVDETEEPLATDAQQPPADDDPAEPPAAERNGHTDAGFDRTDWPDATEQAPDDEA